MPTLVREIIEFIVLSSPVFRKAGTSVKTKGIVPYL